MAKGFDAKRSTIWKNIWTRIRVVATYGLRASSFLLLSTMSALNMEISHAQKRSEPSCPAQKAEMTYSNGRSLLVFWATYIVWKSWLTRRYMRIVEVTVRIAHTPTTPKSA